MAFASSGSIGSVKLGGNFVSTVSEWNISGPQGDRTPLVASNTKRGNLSFVGPKSWTGAFTTNSIVPPIPGRTYAFVGYKGTHEAGFAGPTESGDVIITGINATLDFMSGAPLNWSCDFQGTGALTEATGSVSNIDNTNPSKIQAIVNTLTVVKPGGTSVTTTGWYMDNMSISMTCSASSGKAVAGSGGWKLFVPGPVDITSEISLCNNSRAALNVDVGDRIGITMVFSDGTTMVLKWLQVSAFGQCSIQNSTGENVVVPISTAMDAYDTTGGYGEFSITPMGGSKVTLWPDMDTSSGGGSGSGGSSST